MILFIILLPLLSALIVGLGCRFIKDSHAQLISSSCLVVSAIVAGINFYDVFMHHKSYIMPIFEWVNIGDFRANWSLRVDSLSSIMLVVVTWVSSVVHIYSIGYMQEDKHVPRFMAYLSLFTFFMLMLVTAENLLQLFLGWEGVGVCSYLLIGFWFHKESANNAAIKAFLVNRVGDFGFAIGIFTIYIIFDSISFTHIFNMALSKKTEVINIFGSQFNAISFICFFLFIGSMGKSAQFGLHTWLPDAMEGPTPVSALIHAATMVTAGVFLVVRFSPLFEHSGAVLEFITFIGAITAIFAASVAITQNDIKKIIAYSTCSQLGYMFFACGVSAYSAAIFHLFTHAFFKALLFLSAGNIIHACHHEQDIRNMGGIWGKMPYTYAFMWIGSLALVGIYPLAGFYSKDIILESAYASPRSLSGFAFYIGILVAFLTAFYSWRLLIMSFHGSTRMSEKYFAHVHEPPLVMNLPLIILAVGAIGSGAIAYYLFDIVSADSKFWGDSIHIYGTNILEDAHYVPMLVKVAPMLLGLFGIALAYTFYMFMPELPGKLVSLFKPIYTFLHRKWYFDEIYNYLFVKTVFSTASFLWNAIDKFIIDGFGPNGLSKVTVSIAGGLKKLQTGYIYHYAFAMSVGLILFLGFVILSVG